MAITRNVASSLCQWRGNLCDVAGDCGDMCLNVTLLHEVFYSLPLCLLGALPLSFQSEYAGQTISVASCGGIFVDAGWISTALKPILSHKLEREVFPPDLANMRDELVHDGILRRELAVHLWRREMGKSLMVDGVMGALCRVLVDRGVALPLDPASLLDAGAETARANSSWTKCMRVRPTE